MYQTKWLSTASERPSVALVAVYHCSSVRVGETSSKRRRRSVGSFRERRKDRRSRRLTRMVRLRCDPCQSRWPALAVTRGRGERGGRDESRIWLILRR